MHKRRHHPIHGSNRRGFGAWNHARDTGRWFLFQVLTFLAWGVVGPPASIVCAVSFFLNHNFDGVYATSLWMVVCGLHLALFHGSSLLNLHASLYAPHRDMLKFSKLNDHWPQGTSVWV